MASLKFSAVSPATTSLEDWQVKNGRFANVQQFGLTAIKDWFSEKGNQFVQCESKAFVRPGQFVRILKDNPNAKWGRITEVTEGKGKEKKSTGRYDLELFSDSAEQPEFKLDKEGLLHLLD
jgi:hypothetical protein